MNLGGMHLRRGASLLSCAVVCAVGSACGTQLPDSSFQTRIVTETVGPAAAGASAAASTDAAGQPLAAAPTGAAATAAASGPSGGTAAVRGSGPVAVATGAAPTTGGARRSGATAGAKKTTAGGTGALTASDVGVTPTTITLGNIVSAGGIFGKEQFGVSQYGAQAYVNYLNAHGGINGRKVILHTYNDNGDGSQNVAIVKQAIETDKVFAFIGNNIFQYDGAQEVQDAGVPDILGQQISNVYTKYSHLFTFGGSNLPRNNKDFGFNGYSYTTSEFGHFYHDHLGGSTVGIVYYDQQSSKAGADLFAESYEAGGYKANEYAVNLGLPNFANVVAQMQSDGVDVVGDALDDNGNEKLCQAMEANSTFINQVKAKITTVGSWTQRIASDYKQTPKCQNLIVAGGTSRSYSQTSDPGVAAFRAEMKKDFPSRESLMAQWSFEAWIAGEVFTDAATSCGAKLTRACVEAYMVRPNTLITPEGDTGTMSWDPRPESDFGPGMTQTNCVSVARWSSSVGTWVPLSDVLKDCYTTGFIKYSLG